MSSDRDTIDVGYVATLARMNLTAEETQALQGQMEQIVQYVDKINELDVSDVEPTCHAVEVINVMREDEPRPAFDHDAVMANAPAEADGQFKVPRIVE